MEYYLNTSLQDEINEVWKDIKGFKGLYKASNFGRIKSLSRAINNGAIKPEIILKQTINSEGYVANIFLHKFSNRASFRVSRLIAQTFIPNPHKKPIVNHINSIRHDNRVVNLEWNTAKENVIHGFKNKNKLYRKYKIKRTKINACNINGIYKTYKIKCPTENSVVYIGMTKKTLKRRLRIHYTDKNNTNIHRWVLSKIKSGDTPTIELIEICKDRQCAIESETKNILKYLNKGCKLLNKTFGIGSLGVPSGMFGKKHSEKNKEKFRVINTGRIHSEKTLKKISQSLIGKKRSLESRLKQSRTMMGHKHSYYTKKKMSENNASRIPIVQLDLKNKFVKKWNSITDASRHFKVDQSVIRKYLRSNLKKTHKKKNCKWQYFDKFILKNKKNEPRKKRTNFNDAPRRSI